jgi:hypothetical protein
MDGSSTNGITTHATHAVQSNLISFMRTGNPVIDGILTSLIIALSSYVVIHAGKMWTALCVWLYGKRYIRGRSTVILMREERIGNGRCNVDYDSVLWYISTYCDFSGNVARSFSFEKGARLDGSGIYEGFMPAIDHPITVSYNMNNNAETLVFLELIFREDTDNNNSYSFRAPKNERVHISIDIPSPEGIKTLRRVIVNIRERYRKYKEHSIWTQRMFRMKVENGSFSAWAGAETHSSKSFDTVVLDSVVKSDLVADLHTFLSSEDWYRRMGLSYKRGYMFHGPPGTGKTSSVLAIANTASYDIYSLNLAQLGDDTDLDNAFEKMPERCVVLLEDVDCMVDAVRSRSAHDDDEATTIKQWPLDQEIVSDHVPQDAGNLTKYTPGKKKSIALSCLLNNIDGITNNHGRIFVMTTNRPQILDAALVRFGRIDMCVCLDLCSHEQLRHFYELYYPERDAEQAAADCEPLCAYAERTFEPCEVSSTMLHFRDDPRSAVQKMCERQQQRQRTEGRE